MENNQEYKCIVCGIDLPDMKFNECYKCFNRYFEALRAVERKYENK
jgi:hypothetical protein